MKCIYSLFVLVTVPWWKIVLIVLAVVVVVVVIGLAVYCLLCKKKEVKHSENELRKAETAALNT